MSTQEITPRELWAKQQINFADVNYDLWNKKRESIQAFSKLSQSLIFTVDVFKERYDFASEKFGSIFGFNPKLIKTIRKQGDLLEERIHPDDRDQLYKYQLEHGEFIYSLSPEGRNDYRQIFQIRILNSSNRYINIISHHQVLEKDKNGKAWIILGMMDISPDQTHYTKVKRTVINRKTGKIIFTPFSKEKEQLTNRETEILWLIRHGFLSKEIAHKLNISLHTVNNHRKNILVKLNVNNIIEAMDKSGLFN